MPAADKCHLLIPFKEWAKDLLTALEDVEGVDANLLKTMGERDFENYKAIERRINDPECGGECACGAALRLAEEEGVVPSTGNEAITFDDDLSSGATGHGQFYKSTGWTFGSSGSFDWVVSPPTDGFYHVASTVGVNQSLVPLGGNDELIVELGTTTMNIIDIDIWQSPTAGFTPQGVTYLHVETDVYLETTTELYVKLTNATGEDAPVGFGWLSIHGFCVCPGTTFAAVS